MGACAASTNSSQHAAGTISIASERRLLVNKEDETPIVDFLFTRVAMAVRSRTSLCFKPSCDFNVHVRTNGT